MIVLAQMNETIANLPAPVGSAIIAGLVGALVAGVFAVAANFLGNGYLHHLQVRDRHRDDLDEIILKAWIEHLNSLRSETDLMSVRVWPHATHDGWRARGHELLRTTTFAPPSPLWNAVLQHWPQRRREFSDIEQRLATEERLMGEFLNVLKNDVEKLGLNWEQDAATRKSRREEIQDQNERIRAKGQGAKPVPDLYITWSGEKHDSPLATNAAMVNIWSALVERKLWGKPVRFESEERRDELSLRLADHSEISRGSPEAVDRLRMAFDTRCQNPKTLKDFDEILDHIEQTRERIEALLFEIRRLSHNRKLAGRCEYCPRFLR